MTNTAPEPDNPALDDLPNGDEIHDQYVGEEITPDEDPNITEHHDD